MRHCYVCDSEISGSGFRREVQTSKTTWFSFSSKGRGRRGSGVRMAPRTVCQRCAKSIDFSNRIAFLFKAALVIGVIIWIISNMKS